MESKEFARLMAACSEISQLFPDGVVFIGGIAVYMHAINTPTVEQLAEFTHDGDFYISLADMGDLRDIEELTQNRRLSKHELTKSGFAFDVYTERHSNLIVPYDAVATYAVAYAEIKVASLEHLFALKLEAFEDRKDSAKGDKDAKDLLRIAAAAARRKQPFNAELVIPYVRDDHLPLLQRVEKGSYAMSLVQGNAVKAKAIRGEFTTLATKIRQAYKDLSNRDGHTLPAPTSHATGSVGAGPARKAGASRAVTHAQAAGGVRRAKTAKR